MPYSYTSPIDLPLAPPRNATIPPLWDEIKHGARATKPRREKALEEPKPATIPASALTYLIAHIAHRLTPIPGAIDELRAAVTTMQPILFPPAKPT